MFSFPTSPSCPWKCNSKNFSSLQNYQYQSCVSLNILLDSSSLHLNLSKHIAVKAFAKGKHEWECDKKMRYTSTSPISSRSSLAQKNLFATEKSFFSSTSEWLIRRPLPLRSKHSLRKMKHNALFGLGEEAEYTYENGMAGKGIFLLASPPDPVQFPRKPLDRRFAVLLMRSSYEATDDLNFIAMDKFQAKFWKLRQSEVESYTLQYSPLKIKTGELTDPLYFDFISFAQYATISNAMRTGENVFQERQGAYGELQTIRRDERLKDNGDLPAAFKERVGDKIYQSLLEGFEEKIFDAPPPYPTTAPFTSIVDGVQKILKVFTSEGYALSAKVEEVEERSTGGGRFKVRIEGPATLWGVRALASRRAFILTDFEAMAIGGFLRASNRTCSYKSGYTDTSFVQLWTVT